MSYDDDAVQVECMSCVDADDGSVLVGIGTCLGFPAHQREGCLLGNA